MTDPGFSLERASVAALLTSRSRADRQSLLDELVTMLVDVVPGVQVERTLLRRRVSAVHVPLGDFEYVLTRGDHDTFASSRRHRVRGVVIRTEALELAAFLEELGVALEVELRRTEAGAAALQRWLRTSSD